MMEITLEKAFELFIFDRETFGADATIMNYRVTLRLFIQYLEEQKNMSSNEILINNLVSDDIRSYAVYLRKRKKRNGELLSRRSVKSYMVDVRTFFHFLFYNEYIDKDIMRNIRIIKEEEKIKQPLYLSEVKAIESIFNENSKTGLRNSCIFHLMIDAGLRSGEVCRLKLKDVDFSHSLLNIVNSKGAKGRLVPMVPSLKKLLHKYAMLYRPLSDYNNFLLSSGDEPVPLTGEAIRNVFYRLKRHSEIDRLCAHLCRHTFATAFILQGGDLETLRIYMGHTSYETTRNYLHLAAVYNNMAVDDVYKLHSAFFRRRED